MRRYLALLPVLFVVIIVAGLSRSQGEEPQKPAAAIESDIPGIVFVATPMFDEKTEGGEGVWQGSYHWRDGYIYARSATYHRAERTRGPVRPGRNLYSLIPARPDGKLTRLTHLKSGAVFKPEPHFDGKKVLFSMCRDGEDWFHLYEINIDGRGLKQLTDGPFNDFAGVYLPDGRIVFCSDHTGYLEEYHEERTETLFTMNGDGSGIEQITFAPGTYFEPTVLRDGRILFSFWDAFHIDVPPFDKHETILMTVNPDGTEERHFFGGGQYRFFNRERHSGVGLTQPRELPDGKILVQSEMGPSLLDPAAGLNVADALTPIFPGTTSIQLGGTTHRVHLSPLGTRSTAQPLRDGRFLYARTDPGARDSGLYVCDPQTRFEELVLNIPNYAEFDAVPVLVQKPLPRRLPLYKAGKNETTTRFLVVAGHVTDNPNRTEALKQAKFLRVIEAEYTGVTTSSHTNLETRILGVVPIQPDGSAYFEAPADTPLFLDPLDAGGNRVLMEWNYPNTAVEEGTWYPATQMAYMVGRGSETRACYGCHAPQTDAVPNVTVQALKYPPVQITREATDLQYRRNEPDFYRRQARVGEVAQYRPWLKSSDPEVRARGCEMLMYIEDGTEKDVPTITQLLKDEDVKVRRAAALALTRLATDRERTALSTASQDEDSEVRLTAKAALVALERAGGYAKELEKDALPPLWAIRAAGKRRDAEMIARLERIVLGRVSGMELGISTQERRLDVDLGYKNEFHETEAAIALGRIGTPKAADTLWNQLRIEVPRKKVYISRYLQHGPRPEEYAYLKGLFLAGVRVALGDVHLLIALLPNTFMEKPRYEDRFRLESQRVLLPRWLLERSGHRQKAVALLIDALRGQQHKEDKLYQQILKGINLERPFSEHGRPFPVVKELRAEESLWLLGALIEPAVDLNTPQKRQELEDLVVPYLKSEHHRERIDAAVLLGRTGFGSKAAQVLTEEITKPYSFPEITSIGQGMPGTPYRDKSYLAQTLAMHVADVAALAKFADPKTMYRDIRYGLVRGLSRREKADALPLLLSMATRDPLTLIRQQARYGVADIQDAYRLAGKDVPQLTWPEPQPLEALYPPRGLTWTDTSFEELPAPPAALPEEAADLRRYLKECLSPANFRNLNMAQARGANHMMIKKVEETRLAFAALARTTDTDSRKILLAALETPYPYAHYLAAKALAQRNDKQAIPLLVKKLDQYLQKQDTVGFWWCCEALGELRAKEAVPVLKKYEEERNNPPEIFGPVGMTTSYMAARTLARIDPAAYTLDPANTKPNYTYWHGAGLVRGMAEVNAPHIETVLRNLIHSTNSALVRYEAQVQLNRRHLSCCAEPPEKK